MSVAKVQMLYGTAWKAERTAKLVQQALEAGFRGIVTAAQPRHYQEHLVGQGIRAFLSTSNIPRQSLYVRTKYTPISGQDPKNLPYDPTTSITDQVNASVTSSLRNLRASDSETEQSPYLDCLVLHSPLPTLEQTLEAWTAMSAFVPDPVRSLGVSNVGLPMLQALCSDASVAVRPAVVQNRFYAGTDYDVPIRAFCKANGIAYQGFWTLTGNPKLVRSQLVGELAGVLEVGREVAMYELVRAFGVTVLNGTTTHMECDLEGLRKFDEWTVEEENEEAWQRFVSTFEKLLASS